MNSKAGRRLQTKLPTLRLRWQIARLLPLAGAALLSRNHEALTENGAGHPYFFWLVGH